MRLQILQDLVAPLRAADIRVRAASGRAGFEADRLVGRTTVIEHLAILDEAGLVRRVGEAWAVDQQAMVALLQEIGELARLRATVEVDVDSTAQAIVPSVRPLPDAPRMVIVNGPEAGRAFALEGAGPWRVGRSSENAVPLTHDPHVSRSHAEIARSEGRYRTSVLAGAKNPILVDYRRVEVGASAELRAGSVVLVGATALVLQA